MRRNDTYTHPGYRIETRTDSHQTRESVSKGINKARLPQKSYDDPALALATAITLSAEKAMSLDSFQCAPKHTTCGGA